AAGLLGGGAAAGSAGAGLLPAFLTLAMMASSIRLITPKPSASTLTPTARSSASTSWVLLTPSSFTRLITVFDMLYLKRVLLGSAIVPLLLPPEPPRGMLKGVAQPLHLARF